MLTSFLRKLLKKRRLETSNSSNRFFSQITFHLSKDSVKTYILKLHIIFQEEKEETLEMLEQGQAEVRRRRRKAILKVFLSTATLTFLAEWGDRSQLATVVLATREDAVGVVVGGSLGHALCTGLAVVGGRMVAQRISVRTGELELLTYIKCIISARGYKN